MEPFRAFVGDMLRTDQHSAGYAVQTAFIGAGAFLGSLFPDLLAQLGVADVAPRGELPDTVRISFWTGGAALFLAVMWTVISTREYSPEQQAGFEAAAGETVTDDHAPRQAAAPARLADASQAPSLAWIAAGAAVAAGTWAWGLEKELYLLGALLAGYGVLRGVGIVLAKGGRDSGMLASIVGDFSGMPDVMKRLALVQFFSWSALFVMWIYTTPVVTQYVFGSTDTASEAYNAGATYVGRLFAVYNLVAAFAALLLLPWLSRKFGQVTTHTICLLSGAIGYLGFFFLRDADLLMVCEVFIGIAWAGILAMPYAILASNLPQAKLGIFMGLFNVFVVLPQLLVAMVMGTIMAMFFPGEPVWTMLFAALTLVVAAIAMQRVRAVVPR